jgi:uncharacterized damage-inducible protein DinB
MSPDKAKVISDFLSHAIGGESAATKKVIMALPNDKLDWQPHEKGMKAGDLAWHIVLAEQFFLTAVAEGAFPEFGKMDRPATTAAMVEYYDKIIPPILDKVKNLTAEQAAKTITFHTWSHPAAVYLNLCNVHGVHHRGQLSSYVRAVGAKVPSIYGGSADEKAG